MRGRLLRLPVTTLLALLIAASPAGAETAEQRIVAAIRAALDSGPRVAQAEAELAATVYAGEAETGAGSPSLSYQREGIGAGFENQPNAIHYLRYSMPFHAPWDLGDAKDYSREAASFRSSGTRAVRLDYAGEVAAAWLALAARQERVAVSRLRLSRMDRALELQRHRLELGELSGFEVTQLELQRARDASDLQAAQAESERGALLLRELTTRQAGEPRAGDLAALRERLGTAPPREAAVLEELTGSPLLLAAASRVQAERFRAELARDMAWGQPSFDVQWERVPDLGPIDGFDAFGFMLTVPLPIGKQGKSRGAEARSRVEAADAGMRQARLEMERRARSAIVSHRAAAAALEELKPAVASVDAAARSLAEQFRLGAVSYLAYIDGLSRLEEVRLSNIEATRDLLAARLDLALLLRDPSWFPLPAEITEARR